MCGQCGTISELDGTFCQSCGSLLPDPDLTPSRKLAYSDQSANQPSERAWLLKWITGFVVASVVAAGGLTTLRAAQPEPEEKLAEDSSHRALTLLKSLSEARTLRQARELYDAGTAALSPVVEMLPRLSSDNGTRPRLDAYRSLFRGLASLEHLHRSRPLEWSRSRHQITASLHGLAADEPLTGLLSSQGQVAVDNLQDQFDEFEREQAVTDAKRKVRL
jgi:hypothetical protein